MPRQRIVTTGTRTRVTDARGRASLNAGSFAQGRVPKVALLFVGTTWLRAGRDATTATLKQGMGAAPRAPWRTATVARRRHADIRTAWRCVGMECRPCQSSVKTGTGTRVTDARELAVLNAVTTAREQE